MRTNMKKALAILVSLVMLCGLLPVGMLSVSAAENLVSNGTFESNTDGWSTSSTISLDTSDPASGSSSLKLDCTTVDYAWTYVKISVETNTDYLLTFKGKTASAGLMVNFQSNWTSIADQIPRYTVGQVSSWTDCEYEFNTGDYSSIMIYFQSSWAMGASSYLWIDDVSVTKIETAVTPTSENLLTNGSFEDSSNGWSLGAAGSIVSGGQDGSYALQMTNPTSAYSAIATQTVNVEPSTVYTITWWSKRTAGTGVFNLYLDGATYTGQTNWMNETSGEWVQQSIELTTKATSTSLLVKFSNEAANTSGTILIDNVVLTKNPVASFDGFITNGDFEVGTTTGWSIHQTANISTTAAHSGNYGVHLTGNGSWGGIFSQATVNVEAGKTYVLSFYIKVVTNGITMQILDGTSTGGTKLVNKKLAASDYGSWTLVTQEVTPTLNGFIINFCGIGSSGDANSSLAESVYLDDLKVVEQKEPSDDGYIVNGDFETGSASPWVTYQSTAVTTAAARTDSYGLYMAGTGWGGTVYQKITTLKVGRSYTLSFWIKAVENGMNFKLVQDSTSGAIIDNRTGYYSTSNAGDWTQVSWTFTAPSTVAYLNVSGGGETMSSVVYMDDVVCVLNGENPEDLVTYGGTSARDSADTSGTGLGLAFRFNLTASGGIKSSMNEYQESSAQVLIDDSNYAVIRMGAVMTNQSSVGQSNANFTLDSVTGSKVIDIPAVYLCGLEADSVSFAVRILDIPQAHIGTEIYARPYYVYNNGGTEEIVYGDIQSNNYETASNPKASIKILSIGNSFSKDVMETYLWNMFKEGGYEEVIIGYLYIAGCPMPRHLDNIENGLAAYEYGKNVNGTWTRTYNQLASTALTDEDWDYVTIHSSSDYIDGRQLSGYNNFSDDKYKSMTEYDCIDPIAAWVKDNATNPNVKFDYHMIWAYSEGCDLWSYAYFDYDQMTMYNTIIDKTEEEVRFRDSVNNVIPVGTAIQNGRTSFIGDNFNEPDATQGGSDGYHLNTKYGDYTAALTWYCHYSGDDASIMNGYTGELTEREFLAIAEAVNHAIAYPYVLWESSYTTE